MKLPTRWIVIGTLALLTAAAIVVVFNVDLYLEGQRPALEAAASQRMGREVRFEGIAVSLWPGPGIRLESPSISDDPSYSDEPFFTADAIEVRIGLLAALLGNISIGSASIEAPVVHIIHRPEGMNIDSLGDSPAEKPEPARDASEDELQLLIQNFETRDGTLHYSNSIGEFPYTIVVRRLTLEAEDWQPDLPFAFEARGAILDPKNHDTRLVIWLHPGAGEGEIGLDIDLTGTDYESSEVIQLPPIAERLPEDFSATGPMDIQLSLERRGQKIAIDGRLDIGDVALRLNTLHKAAGTPLALHVIGSISSEFLDFEQLELEGDGLSVVAEGRFKRTEPSALEFRASNGEFVLEALGLHDPSDQLAAEILTGIEASGQLSFADPSGPTGRIQMNSPAGNARGVAYESLDIEVDLQGGSTRAAIRTPSLRLGRLALTELALDLGFEGDGIRLETARAKALGGNFVASGHTSSAGATRRSRLDLEVDDALAERLDDFFGRESGASYSGQLDLELSLRGIGSSWDELRSSLRGGGLFRIENGKLRRVNLAKGAVDTLLETPVFSLLFTPSLQKAFPEVFESDQTVFDTIEFDFELGEGVVRTGVIEIIVPSYQIVGKGSVTLLGDVDAEAVLTFSEHFTRKLGVTGSLISGLLNPAGLLAIPVKLVGTIPDVRTEADPTYLARALRDNLLHAPLDALIDLFPHNDAGSKGSRR